MSASPSDPPVPRTITCPACGARGRFAPKREITGPLRIRCKACGELFRIDPAGDPAPAPHRLTAGLTPGQVLADRYRIVVPLGQGGMGEVYEAEDLELGGRVALKTVKPELAAQPDAMDRFKREIQLARRVTHPNVCRVFDVFRHRGEDGSGVVFLTMELLKGDTLSGRLARGPRFSTEEALPLARQLADALDAAHRAGVVHRDFKSGNVMLVPEPGGGTRAVVTDFGLARPAPDSGVTAALTVGKDSLGTPDYMAPEQVEGGEITSAVDVYAFGVTLYEMVTGERPFAGGSALTTAVRRLSEPPPPPSDRVPDLDPRWERMILGCLARRPTERFASAGEALRAVEGPSPSMAAPPPPVQPPAPFPDPDEEPEPTSEAPKPPARTPKQARAHRLKVIGLLGIIAIALAVAVYRASVWEPPDSPVLQVLGVDPGDVVIRRAVAVTPLRDLAGGADSAWLATAVPEMLRTELRGGEALRVVGDDAMARLDPELVESRSDPPSPESLERLRRALGADYVVTGSYAVLGQAPERRVRLDLHLHDAVRGRSVASLRETGTEAELFELVARSGAALLERLDVERPSDGGGASLPVTPEAARLYAEGIARLNRYEPAAARDLLQEAAALEPRNPLVRSALASAWASLGYQGRAREQAEQALAAGDDLPREERLSIEAQLLEAGGEWERAAESYRGLWALFPDDPEYGVRRVTAQIRAGRARDALTTVAALRTLPDPGGSDPRIDLAESRAATALGAFERAREAAARGALRSAERELPALVAQARLAECEALRNLGRVDEARSACAEAERLAAERGDRMGRVAALAGLGGVLYDAGDLTGARERFEEAVAIHRDAGSQGTAPAVLNNLAVVLRNQGDLERAGELYREALEITRETGSELGEAYTLGNLASLLLQQGELERASVLTREGLEIVRSAGDRAGEAAALDRLGVIAHLGGDLPAAGERFGEALALQRTIGQRRAETGTLAHMGRLALDAGDPETAEGHFRASLALSRQTGHRDLTAAALLGLGLLAVDGPGGAGSDRAAERLAEALAIQEELEQRSDAVETRTALAELALLAGAPERALEHADAAAGAAAALGLRDRHARALSVTARARAAAGDAAGALEAADAAEAAAAETGNLRLRTAVALDVALARRAAGAVEATGDGDPLAALTGPDAPFPGLAGKAERARATLGADGMNPRR